MSNLEIIIASTYLRKPIANSNKVNSIVKTIIDEIKAEGDQAILKWSLKIDGFEPNLINLKPFEDYQLNSEHSQAIIFAHHRIKKFAEFQLNTLQSSSYNDEFGEFGFDYQPLERVGAYIPAGKYPLISSALMTLTPAKVAGCQELIACSPSNNKFIQAAASLAGATQFLQLGGAQAIGALSFGFAQIDPVNIIVGPGNAFVNRAKSLIMNRTSIDSLAGPSEIMIYANSLENPEWIIQDALAQAEHDLNAKSIIVSSNKVILTQLQELFSASEPAKSLIENQQIELILTKDHNESVNFINEYAPEHLMICDKKVNRHEYRNYGAMFLGERSAVAFGDYCSGPNHTLPTGGNAKNTGGLNVLDFLKIQTHQQLSKGNIDDLKSSAYTLATLENLTFHSESIKIR